MHRHIVIKLLKTKEKEKYLKGSLKKNDILPEKNNSNDSGCLIKNHGERKEVAQYFKC